MLSAAAAVRSVSSVRDTDVTSTFMRSSTLKRFSASVASGDATPMAGDICSKNTSGKQAWAGGNGFGRRIVGLPEELQYRRAQEIRNPGFPLARGASRAGKPLGG